MLEGTIGERMKENYERPAKYRLTPRVPVIIRLDGRAFHTYTRHMDKPFDDRLMDAMEEAAWAVLREASGARVAYLQSDEVSILLTDYDTIRTESWFGYVKSKVESVAASIMTARFNRVMQQDVDAHFDARAFNVPREDVSNYFLWRVRDWLRNSLQMYARSFFSHKQLHGKKTDDLHEMLHAKGKNWATDLTDRQKNGKWLFVDGTDPIVPLVTYESISLVLDPILAYRGANT